MPNKAEQCLVVVVIASEGKSIKVMQWRSLCCFTAFEPLRKKIILYIHRNLVQQLTEKDCMLHAGQYG